MVNAARATKITSCILFLNITIAYIIKLNSSHYGLAKFHFGSKVQTLDTNKKIDYVKYDFFSI